MGAGCWCSVFWWLRDINKLTQKGGPVIRSTKKALTEKASVRLCFINATRSLLTLFTHRANQNQSKSKEIDSIVSRFRIVTNAKICYFFLAIEVTSVCVVVYWNRWLNKYYLSGNLIDETIFENLKRFYFTEKIWNLDCLFVIWNKSARISAHFRFNFCLNSSLKMPFHIRSRTWTRLSRKVKLNWYLMRIPILWINLKSNSLFTVPSCLMLYVILVDSSVCVII